MSARHANRGSAILLAVGLVTIIALLGGSFMLIARLDRRQARAVAAAAADDGVGIAVAMMVAEDRYEDLYMTAAGPYGGADEWAKRVDAANADTDTILASIVRTGSGTDTWGQVSKLAAMTDVSGNFTNVVDSDTRLTDTDGDGAADAILWPSGIYNIKGEEYYIAVRVIDAGGLANANTAYEPFAATAGQAMPVTSVALEGLMSATHKTALHAGAGVVKGRRGDSALEVWTGTSTADWYSDYVLRAGNPLGTTLLPFDMGDMLAVAWRGSGFESGRLYDLLSSGASDFTAARKFLTTWSASGIYISQPVTGDMAQTVKADLNAADFNTLFTAFYNAIPAGVVGLSDDDATRRRSAAQLAVNVIDYRDTDSNVTAEAVPGVSGTYVYGIERQPFITEAFIKRYQPPGSPTLPPVQQYSAIELYNPYSTTINLGHYKLLNGTTNTAYGDWSGKTIPPGGRAVIVSDSDSDKIPVAGGATLITVNGLVISQPAYIYRSANTNGSGDDILIGSIALNVDGWTGGVADEEKTKVRQWDDVAAHARYTLDLHNDLANRDYTGSGVGTGSATSASTNLGVANDSAPTGGTEPACPVYIRDGEFISIGELNRIFYLGPNGTASLRLSLQANVPVAYNNGRLAPEEYGSGQDDKMAGTTPDVPVGALLCNYLMVASPQTDGVDNDGDGTIDNDTETTVYGKININTAPKEVLVCLPGLASLSPGNRNDIADAIIAYRNAPAPDGYFISPAHAAVPIATAGQALSSGTEKLPRNTYSTDIGDNYNLLANQDDGLPTSTGNRINDDLIKYGLYYTWLANSITVRSDVYIAYIRVQTNNDVNESQGVQFYVAVIDRSNCRTTTDRPQLRMFAQTQ